MGRLATDRRPDSGRKTNHVDARNGELSSAGLGSDAEIVEVEGGSGG
jgi:hypothetical protein